MSTSLPWHDAIIEVLSEHQEAMHYADIADAVLEGGLRDDGGATPANSANAVITKNLKEEGENSVFVRVGRGEYMLRDLHEESGAVQNGSGSLNMTFTEESKEFGDIVHAFGMYWQRDLVDWSKTAPSLYGKQNRKARKVDFSGQLGVYLLHDRRETIYIGRTTDQSLAERLRQHTYNRLNGRWDRFSWFGLLPVSEEGQIQHASTIETDRDGIITVMEALLIEALEPPQNRRRGDGFKAVKYLQADDDELKKSHSKQLLMEMIQDL